jgi:hypothetical protein
MNMKKHLNDVFPQKEGHHDLHLIIVVIFSLHFQQRETCHHKVITKFVVTRNMIISIVGIAITKPSLQFVRTTYTTIHWSHIDNLHRKITTTPSKQHGNGWWWPAFWECHVNLKRISIPLHWFIKSHCACKQCSKEND